MLLLSLFWVLLGLLIGALANVAKLRPAAWVRGGRLGMLGLGALIAVLGGWLGTLARDTDQGFAPSMPCYPCNRCAQSN